jgi:hypothetical protein
MSLSGRLGTVLGVVVAAVLAAGCGEAIDHVKMEALVQENLESIGKKVSSVECPSGVKIEPGHTFACTVKISGGKTETATVKIVNKNADTELTDLSPKK